MEYCRIPVRLSYGKVFQAALSITQSCPQNSWNSARRGARNFSFRTSIRFWICQHELLLVLILLYFIIYPRRDK